MAVLLSGTPPCLSVHTSCTSSRCEPKQRCVASVPKSDRRFIGALGAANRIELVPGSARLGWATACLPKATAVSPVANAGDSISAASSGVPSVPDSASEGQWWDSVTERLVQASTIPFLFLLLPQVIKNTVNVMAGNSAALSVLSWVCLKRSSSRTYKAFSSLGTWGFLTAVTANTLLVTYFVKKGENGAVLVQAMGVISNFTLLVQIFMAGYMPAPAFLAVVSLVAAGALVNGSQLLGLLEKSDAGKALWSLWGDATTLIGLAVLPQALLAAFTDSTSLLPGAAAVAAGLGVIIAQRRGQLPDSAAAAWGSASGWAATLLFMFQPLAQLARNFSDPASLAGLSLGTVLLATVANGMMVPRALATRDTVWFTGSAWGCVFNWAQLLSMFLGRTSAGGKYIGDGAFAAATIAVVVFLGGVALEDAKSKGLSSPFAALKELVTGRSKTQ